MEWTGTAANATVKLYKAAKDPLTNEFDPDDLVAEGTCDITANPTEVAFSERNGSGVNGQLELDTAAGAVLPSDVVLVTQTVDRVNTVRDARIDLGGTVNGGWQLSMVADGADANGAAGNNISVEMIDTGIKGTTLNASLEQIDPNDATKGYKISVRLATSATTGAITSTAADIETAILNVASAASGASVDLFNNGASITSNAVVVDARAETFFAGGCDVDKTFNVEGHLQDAETISISGAELGVNTDANGQLYFEVVDADNDGQPTEINVYKDSSKSAASLVAKWQGAESGGNATETIFLDEQNDSGLRIALVADTSGANELQNGDSTLSFDLGLRMSSSEYGSSEFVRVQSLEGNMWDVQDANASEANNRGYVNLDSSTGSVTMESRGSGAQLAVNGQDLFTDGLVAEAATPDFNGHLVFLEGELGETHRCAGRLQPRRPPARPSGSFRWPPTWQPTPVSTPAKLCRTSPTACSSSSVKVRATRNAPSTASARCRLPTSVRSTSPMTSTATETLPNAP